jgi:predicted Na+-dependent transporter
MDPLAAANSLLATVVFALVFAVGLRTRLSDLGWVAREKGHAARAFVALFVVVPVTSIAVSVGLGLAPAAALFLLMLSVAPLPPLYPAAMQKLGVADEAAVGLGAFAAVAALVLAPLMLWFVSDVSRIPIEVPLAAMLTPLLKQMLLPLLAGMVASGRNIPFAIAAASAVLPEAMPMIAGTAILMSLLRALVAPLYTKRIQARSAANPV